MQKSPGLLRLLRERPRDGEAIEEMTAAAFGPDRFHKTVYRLREDVPPIKELCFVCLDQKNRLVASIRNWPILINEKWPAVMLGPLAISPELRGLGYGKALMWHSMAQSRTAGAQPHHPGRRPGVLYSIRLPPRPCAAPATAWLGRGAPVPGARAGRGIDDRRARHDR